MGSTLVLEADHTGYFRVSADQNDGQTEAELQYSVAGDTITLVVADENGRTLWENEGNIQGRRLVFYDATWEKQ